MRTTGSIPIIIGMLPVTIESMTYLSLFSNLFLMSQEQAFIKILEVNQQRIQKICGMYTSTPEDCKDLVQEVILNIWKAYPSFEGKSAVNTWVYRIILNVCLKKRFLQKKAQKTVSLDGLSFDPVSETASQNDSYLALKECITQLEFSDRAIIILFLEDMAYKEIAEIIGISENYVAVKIKRIKAKLAVCLKHNLS